MQRLHSRGRPKAMTSAEKSPNNGRTAEQPFVSVIMPIRNESDFIEQSLGAVLAQDYPHDRIEVVIADGMSIDGSREKVAQLAAECPTIPIIILDNSALIPAVGLNLAVAGARGDVIIRVDGHTIIAADYVRQCVQALDRSGADNVGGRMKSATAVGFARAVALATGSRFGVGGARFHYSDREEWVDTVYLGAWRRHIFDRIGLFDEELVRNQDDEFNYRLRSKGGRILLSPKIRSSYHNRRTGPTLWRQYFQYGYWKVRVMQKHPLQMQPRQFVPAAFVAALAIFTLLAPFTTIGKWGLGLSGAIYLAANLAASAYASGREGMRLLPLVSLSYATLHLAYGAGFLIGLVSFWNRWGRSEGDPRRPTAEPHRAEGD